MFEYHSTIKMHETDAGGVLFFANQFKLVHDAYEAFLESKGITIKDLLVNTAFHLPIVHAETDFKAPLRVGDRVVVRLKMKKTGTTSFTLAHEIYKDGAQLTGAGETVHVCIDKNTGAKIHLPKELLETICPGFS
ncbi:MAG: 1,4-dihydroxy-2-naphthoyl-CoA hydrolase [Acidobacteriota bacterium]|nr:1,4-dihydroxy-2-naphthoyl-CoA hydrolase [Acidobacteriota bacterium]